MQNNAYCYVKVWKMLCISQIFHLSYYNCYYLIYVYCGKYTQNIAYEIILTSLHLNAMQCEALDCDSLPFLLIFNIYAFKNEGVIFMGTNIS